MEIKEEELEPPFDVSAVRGGSSAEVDTVGLEAIHPLSSSPPAPSSLSLLLQETIGERKNKQKDVQPTTPVLTTNEIADCCALVHSWNDANWLHQAFLAKRYGSGAGRTMGGGGGGNGAATGAHPQVLCRQPHLLCRQPHLLGRQAHLWRQPHLLCRHPHLLCRHPHLRCLQPHLLCLHPHLCRRAHPHPVDTAGCMGVAPYWCTMGGGAAGMGIGAAPHPHSDRHRAQRRLRVPAVLVACFCEQWLVSPLRSGTQEWIKCPDEANNGEE
ncbi:hypothetical protein T08_3918 [Trichinella sp. T8]|nr:hypothetical protein T08_3918 [Trichinella sp. T8]